MSVEETAMTPIEKSTPTASPIGEVNGALDHHPMPKNRMPSPEEQAVLKARIEAINPRRIDLIKKELAEGLTEQEAQELERLQNEMDGCLDALWPLPFHIIEEIKAIARREGLLKDEASKKPTV
jgi:hypothetical protein